MPKAKSGNFHLKKIVRAVPADKAAHRFVALQRSGRFSELRFVQRGKSSFDIVGYEWPDKGVRRRLGIGRARKNPDQFAPGDVVSMRLVTLGDKVQWIDAQVVDVIGHDANGRAFYKCKYELGGKFFDKVCPASDVGPADFPAFVPSTRNQSAGRDYEYEKQVATTIWRQISLNVKMAIGAHSASILEPKGDYLAGLQFKVGGRLRTFQIYLTGQDLYDVIAWQGRARRGARPATSVVEKKVSGVYAEDLDGILADLYTRTKNPSAKGGRVTPNQVLFGMRGRTVVGWISKETPTKYLISYKVGAALRHVWRGKDKVKFQSTGKYGKVPNNCPTQANPNAELADNIRLFKKFNGFDAKRVRQVEIDWPKAAMLIGPCVRLDYFSKKWDHKGKVYFHEFEKPCQVFAPKKRQPDGDNLLIIKGKFEIRPEGITG